VKKLINSLVYGLKVVAVGIWMPLFWGFPRMLDYETTKPIVYWVYVIVMAASFFLAVFLFFRSVKKEHLYYTYPEER